MALQTLNYLYCTSTDVQNYLSVNGVNLRLDDDQDGDVTDEQQRMVDSITDATETINYYLWSKHSDASLAKSNLINRWCTHLAAYALCSCRGDEPPESVIDRAEKAEEKLKEVRDGNGKIPNIALRMTCAPTFDNTRLNPRYDFKVIRVERKTSSKRGTQAPLPDNPDYQDLFTFEDFII